MPSFIAFVTCLVALVGCDANQIESSPPSAAGGSGPVAPPSAAETNGADLRRLGLFELPLVPVGRPEPSDRALLMAAVTRYRDGLKPNVARDRVEPIVAFTDAHPDSAWTPALLVNLGSIYRQTGHFSKALDAWQRAWSLAREAEDADGRAVGDAALGHLSQLLAYLGRQDELRQLLAAVANRPIRGTAAELVSESARGLADMRAQPELSFKCGPFALSRILQYHNAAPSQRSLELLQAAHSTAHGLSLSDVRAISERAGMHYQMAFRSPGAAVVIPAVAHWKVGHYAALVDRELDRFRIEDATFGEDIRMSERTLDEEASGYFMIPPGALPEGWRAVSAAEGGKVWGRGDTGNNKDNGATGAGDAMAATPGGATCPAGCTTWNVEPMVVSLALQDIPIGRASAVGPAVLFDLHYSQRDVQQPQLFNYVNLGRKWTTSWLSYVTDNGNVNGTVDLYRRGGGDETFAFDSNANTSKRGAFSQTTITRVLDALGNTSAFIRQFADGSSEEFSESFGTKFFMTKVIDPQANAVTIQYDAMVRITSISDALGQVTTLSYELASDPLK
ncbi:MAG TPA: cysteine peptidase family C39 domain-containing protein, partial [Polyangiales bacterium]|nr:cysteine peptidase family C39 domain-containing protein [Polyangiales bacterium]